MILQLCALLIAASMVHGGCLESFTADFDGGCFEDDQAARLVDALGDVSVPMGEFRINIDCSLSILNELFKRVPAKVVNVEFRCYCVSCDDILMIVDSILSNGYIEEVGGDSLRCMMDYTIALSDTPAVVLGAMRKLLPKADSVLANNFFNIASRTIIL